MLYRNQPPTCFGLVTRSICFSLCHKKVPLDFLLNGVIMTTRSMCSPSSSNKYRLVASRFPNLDREQKRCHRVTLPTNADPLTLLVIQLLSMRNERWSTYIPSKQFAFFVEPLPPPSRHCRNTCSNKSACYFTRTSSGATTPTTAYETVRALPQMVLTPWRPPPRTTLHRAPPRHHPAVPCRSVAGLLDTDATCNAMPCG